VALGATRTASATASAQAASLAALRATLGAACATAICSRCTLLDALRATEAARQGALDDSNQFLFSRHFFLLSNRPLRRPSVQIDH
jgi:hypothetical protein